METIKNSDDAMRHISAMIESEKARIGTPAKDIYYTLICESASGLIVQRPAAELPSPAASD